MEYVSSKLFKIVMFDLWILGDILKYFSTYDIFIPGKSDKNLIGQQQTKMLPTGKMETENK